MSPEEISGTILAVAAIAILASAALSDLKIRRVSDVHWILLCAAGIPLQAVCLFFEHGAETVPFYAAGSACMCAYALSPRLSGMSGVAAAVAALILSAVPLAAGMPFGAEVLASAVFMWGTAGLYAAGLITGGADAKCLIALAAVLPVLPAVPGIPALWEHPAPCPSLSVLFFALLFVLAAAPFIALANAREGYFGKGLFSTRPKKVSEIDTDFEWPAERIVGGKKVFIRGNPDDAEEILKELKEAGIGEARVTPALPFLVPVAVSAVLVTVAGDPVCALV